jgi:hypothetical protein
VFFDHKIGDGMFLSEMSGTLPATRRHNTQNCTLIAPVRPSVINNISTSFCTSALGKSITIISAVLIAVTKRHISPIYCDVTPCSMVVHRRFRGASVFRVEEQSKQQAICVLLVPWLDLEPGLTEALYILHINHFQFLYIVFVMYVHTDN